MSKAGMRVAVMVTAGAVMVAGAGCTSSTHSSVVHAAARIVDPPIGTVFDGVTLQGIIAGATLPAGYSLSNGQGGNSGPKIVANGADTFGSLSCGDAVADVGNPGFGESSFAAQVASQAPSGSGSSDSGPAGEIVTSVYQYAGDGGAQALYSAALGSWSRCSSFTLDLGGSQVPTVLNVGPSGPVPGASKAADLQETVTAPDGETESVDAVIALDGDAVVITGLLVPAGSGGARAAVSSAAAVDGSVLAAMNAAQLSGLVPSGASSVASARFPAGK